MNVKYKVPSLKVLAIAWLSALGCGETFAATFYVDSNSSNSLPPYASWATAARTIQDAVDAAVGGDRIIVTNGVYDKGGHIAGETSTPTTNRVAVTKPLTILSVNGPAVTTIQGYQVPGITNGDSAVRCAYLTNGAILAGFTLTGGATGTNVPDNNYTRRYASANGGGVLCESTSAIVSNCVLIGNSAFWWGGGANRGTLLDCMISNNLAGYAGGGACGEQISLTEVTCSLSNCIITGNGTGLVGYDNGGGALNCEMLSCVITGNFGGGAIECDLTNCVVIGNQGLGALCSASNCVFIGNTGGGASGNLIRCIVSGNSTQSTGGGATTGVIQDCIITNNSAATGGGTANATLINCLIAGNTADYGGGDYGSTLFSCTVVGNSANIDGGGTYLSSSRNCILYYNSSPGSQNYFEDAQGVSVDFCCTIPMPTNGIRNIIAPPLFANLVGGDFRLQTNSPCIDAGNNAYTTVPYPGDIRPPITWTDDLDGNPRIVNGLIDLGAYEWQSLPANIPPRLSIARGDNAIVLSWPASASNYTLQASTRLTDNPSWSPLTEGISKEADRFVITNNTAALQGFYRLQRN